MSELGGKVALITGAGGGIGAATARICAGAGAAVALCDLPGTAAEAVAHEIAAQSGKAHFTACDVANEESVRAAVAEAVEAFGSLHIVINIAGINRYGRVEYFSADDWDAVMMVNVRGMFLMIKHAVPHLRAAGGGAVVNMASVSAFIGSDGYSAYHTSKAAVLGLTRSLALELAPDNIRVNALCPGWVDTPFSDRAITSSANPSSARAGANTSHALGRMARPDEVARAALFLASDAASFITGTELVVDGGFLIKH